jgi:uncharacterized protein YodC (DUF2158 family)
MNVSDIKPGDVVYLNSGSPPMTVIKVDGVADCTWLATNGETQRYSFLPVMLSKEQHPEWARMQETSGASMIDAIQNAVKGRGRELK